MKKYSGDTDTNNKKILLVSRNGIEKCVIVIIKSEKNETTEGIRLPSQEAFGYWREGKQQVELKSKLVEGDQKAPFSIATTPSCRRGRYSFSWVAPVYP